METDYNLENLLTSDELENFSINIYRINSVRVIIFNSAGELLNSANDSLNDEFSNFSSITQEIKNIIKNANVSEEENAFYPVMNGKYNAFIKPVYVYNYLSGFFCCLFIDKNFNLKASEAVFNLFEDKIKSKYEISDLVKYSLKHYKQISLLTLISEGMLYASDLQDIYKKTLEIMVFESEALSGMIFSFDKDAGILELMYKIPETDADQNYALFMDENIIAKSVKEVSPIIINNVQSESDFIHPLPFLSPDNYLIVPLNIKDRITGVVAVCDKKEGKDFSSIDSRLIHAIGAQAAITIENLRLFFELKQSFIKTIEALSNAIDKKDKFAKGHSKRVSEISLAIAEEMNIKDLNLLEDLKTGALLHDIGKIAIPTEILYKPTYPNEEEWEIIRKHPEAGYEIVKDLTGFKGILPIIRYHHERWDGKGYPRGLKEEDIPLTTRIVTVADAFDTIISKRPYKEAMTPDEAQEAIKKATGKHFDKTIVNAFLSAFAKGKIEVKHDN